MYTLKKRNESCPCKIVSVLFVSLELVKHSRSFRWHARNRIGRKRRNWFGSKNIQSLMIKPFFPFSQWNSRETIGNMRQLSVEEIWIVLSLLSHRKWPRGFCSAAIASCLRWQKRFPIHDCSLFRNQSATLRRLVAAFHSGFKCYKIDAFIL